MIWHYEFVLNVKTSGTDIFFDAILVFEDCGEYWSSFPKRQCVGNIWKSIFFLNVQRVLRGCLFGSSSGHTCNSFSLPSLSCRKTLQQQLVGWPVALFSNPRGFLETLQLCMILFLLVWLLDPLPWTEDSCWF